MADEELVPIPRRLLDRIAEIDLDELGSWVDPDAEEANAVYEDIDAIGDLTAYMRGD